MTGHGGQAAAVLHAARRCRVEGIGDWLLVGAAAIGGTSGFVDDAAAGQRLAALADPAGR